MYKVGDEVLVKAEVKDDDGHGGKLIKLKGIDGLAPVWFEVYELIPADKTYESGLHDAWELAKKIAGESKDGGIPCDAMCVMFGTDILPIIFTNFTFEDCRDKIEAYEKEKEIKVENVVEDNEGTKALVIDEATENTCFVFTENGCVEEWYKRDLKNTGKKISIESLLKEIGE